MVTITTEIQGTPTSTEYYARGSVVEGIHTHLAFEGAIQNNDPFQDYPAGYLALKHQGWLLGREQCGTPLGHPAVDFDGWLDRACNRAFSDPLEQMGNESGDGMQD